MKMKKVWWFVFLAWKSRVNHNHSSLERLQATVLKEKEGVRRDEREKESVRRESVMRD